MDFKGEPEPSFPPRQLPPNPTIQTTKKTATFAINANMAKGRIVDKVDIPSAHENWVRKYHPLKTRFSPRETTPCDSLIKRIILALELVKDQKTAKDSKRMIDKEIHQFRELDRRTGELPDLPDAERRWLNTVTEEVKMKEDLRAYLNSLELK